MKSSGADEDMKRLCLLTRTCSNMFYMTEARDLTMQRSMYEILFISKVQDHLYILKGSLSLSNILTSLTPLSFLLAIHSSFINLPSYTFNKTTTPSTILRLERLDYKSLTFPFFFDQHDLLISCLLRTAGPSSHLSLLKLW